MDPPPSGPLARLEAAIARGPEPAALARVGLGLTIALAGVHKLLAPAPWDALVVNAFAGALPVSVRVWTLANGVAEIAVGAGLLVDRLTAPLAAFVCLSLLGTLCYIGAVVALGAEAGVSAGTLVVIGLHDVGLAGLAAAVSVRAARS
jgi:uncharacterized membrane protein